MGSSSEGIPRRRRFQLAWGVAACVGIAGVWGLWRVRELFSPAFHAASPAPAADARAPTAFVDVTLEAGFDHVHHKPALDKKLEPIMSWVASVGAAAAAGDFDDDGRVDLYVTDSDKGRPNHLYRNRGDGTFTDVAEAAGVARVNDENGVSMDCVFGDYDNDGWLDLYVVQWGRNRLFHNRRDGTFADVTERAFRDEHGRPGSPWANACAAVWFDYDGDGLLDIYVGNYFAPFDLWHLEHTRIMHDSFEHARNAGRNSLWHNDGDGVFTDVAARLGVDDPGWTLAVGHGDLNNDGWQDLYVADDFGPDQLYMNGRDGTFRNVTETVLGYDTKKGMNAEFGDFDNDGWLDVQVSNITTAEYLKEGNMLWRNATPSAGGDPLLIDIARESGAENGGWAWGAKFFDFDNDGDLDIYGAAGFVTAGEGDYWYDLASWTVLDRDVSDALNWPPIGDRTFSGHDPNRLWRNDGRWRFTEIAARAGVDDRRDGRGVVVFDYDNDGDLDLFVANQGAAPVFYRNDVGSRGHWLGLRLKGRPQAGSNRDAVGARVTISTPAGRQIRELDGGNGYGGQSDRRVWFGLGGDPKIDALEIRWPSRRVQVLRRPRADQILEVEEPAELPEVASLVPTSRTAASAPAAREPAPAAEVPDEEIDALLSRLEDQLRLQVDDIALASKYRAQCARNRRHDRSIGFLESLAREQPASRGLLLQLGAAYIDKIPTCGGVAAVVSKGILAKKALDLMDAVLESDGSWWPAVYSRGMNHLHWPRALRHSAAAAADFRRCIELQNRSGPPGARGYFVRAYIGLGDALAKNGELEGAREAWRRGLEVFPASPELKRRASLRTADEARVFIEEARSLEQPIDTDFSFLLDA